MLKTNRISEFEVQVDNKQQSIIYANDKLELERSALEELETFSEIEGINDLSLTPDFHKGSGTPIGTVAAIDRMYPKVIGNDIGCGMRLDLLSIKNLEVTEDLKNKLRHAFFEGGREILVPNRKDILAIGLCSIEGFTGYSVERIPKHNVDYSEGYLGNGSYVSDILNPYTSITSDRDNILGSIGGGNHFVEIQQIDEIVDKQTAYILGMRKGQYCLMCHSGSLDNGHQVGNHFKDKAKALHQGKHPKNGYFALDRKDGLEYLLASYNAANFAMVNRAVMAGMVAHTLNCELVATHDSPHNFVHYDGDSYLYRKGACSAMQNELVIVPGSMGTRSFIGIGQGFQGTLNSAPHGAGRTLNRNSARSNVQDLAGIQLVTKIDPLKTRPDVAKEVYKDLAEEAPRSYKDITEVINTSVAAQIVKPLAWLKPILTIKG